MAVDFVQLGGITPAGKQVITHITEQIKEAEKEKNPDFLNALAGHVKHYYINVFKTHLMTEAEWMRDYRYGAEAVYSQIMQLQEAETEKTKLASTADGMGKLEAKFTAMQESLGASVKALEDENAALKAKLDELAKPVEGTEQVTVDAEADKEVEKGKK